MSLPNISGKKQRFRGLIEFWNLYKQKTPNILGIAILFSIISIAISAEFISPYNPTTITRDFLAPPSFAHPMGTDALGRDVLSRIIWGSRIALMFGFGAAGISLLFGILLGAIPGYYGGILDDAIGRFIDVFLMVPRFFLVIVIIAIFGNNIIFSMLVVSFTYWPSNARIARAQTLSLKKRVFVDAAKISGMSNFSIIFKHILPNGIYPIVANSTAFMAQAVLIEAALSYLGLGDISKITWGQMLYDARLHLMTSIWPALFSGLSIVVLVVGFYLVGNGINYAMNPRLRTRG